MVLKTTRNKTKVRKEGVCMPSILPSGYNSEEVGLIEWNLSEIYILYTYLSIVAEGIRVYTVQLVCYHFCPVSLRFKN